jgi:hypothetical protein
MANRIIIERWKPKLEKIELIWNEHIIDCRKGQCD